MSKLPRRLLMSLVPLVLLLGGVELALRVADWPQRDPDRPFEHNTVYWKEDPGLHLEPFPHKETGGTFRVSTDANGLRAPLHAEARPDGVFRIMALGCSTTFGWGVDDDQTWPAVLEALLTAQGKRVEVVNGAQKGHTSFQGRWMWETTLRRYDPDLVVFGYIVQDARTVAYSDRSQAILQKNSEFFKQNLLYRLRSYVALREGVDAWRSQSKDRPRDGGSFRVPIEEYVENIRQFRTYADEAGATLVLFGFPLERAGYTEKHRAILHAAAEDPGVAAPLYDPQPEFERYTANEVLFFPQDRGHANAAGHLRVAQGMAQFLVAHSLLPR